MTHLAKIAFYHLTATPIERMLPKLLEKSYHSGMRALLLVANEQEVNGWNERLWTYDPDAFLPHGAAKDGSAHRQPIWISTQLEWENSPALAAVTDGRTLPPEAAQRLQRIVDILDAAHAPQQQAASQRAQEYRTRGHSVQQYVQDARGAWQEMAA